MNEYAPWVRISLRYGLTGVFFKSPEIAQALSTDPDIIAAGCVVVAGIVETSYKLAKRWGWTL